MGEKKFLPTSEQVTKDSILKVGKVVSVTGRTVKVKVDKAKNVSHLLFNGEIVKNISVGGYLKIRKGFETIVGKIEGEYINENIFENSKNYLDKREKIDRALEIKLIGYYDLDEFKKGIKELPLIDNECYLLSKEEYVDIHKFVRKDDIPLNIGVLSSDESLPISVGVNSLFASHVGIFGNTGSGKSYTLAGLYSKLFNRFSTSQSFKENARFYLMDFNGEYIKPHRENELDSIIVDAQNKHSFRLSTRNPVDKFPLSLEAINDEILWIIASEATEKTQAPFIRRALKNNTIESKFSSSDSFKSYIVEMVVGMAKTKNKEFLPIISNFLKELSRAIYSCADNMNEAEESIVSRMGFFNNTSEFYIALDTGWVYANTDGFQAAIENQFANFSLRLEDMNIFTKIYTKIILHFYLEILKGYSNREHIAPMIKRL